ncbi:MAG: division/cell wall cluster transcriptional repressor MraZ [Clostridia bacterium]|nr:division/cell wall cluster transcriptional repressor MraZ [Clostridia bacterium]
MFLGEFQNSIDSKSRIIIPAKFRYELGDSCIVSMSLDKCLTVSTREEWEKFLGQLVELPISNKDVRLMRRYFGQAATVCEIDKQGRITIPQKLKEYAEIDKELVTVGNITNIEVWSKENWDTIAFAQDGVNMSVGELDASALAEKLGQFNF